MLSNAFIFSPMKQGQMLVISVKLPLLESLNALARATGLPTIAYARMVLTQHCQTHRPAEVPITIVSPQTTPVPGIARKD